jgi:hypothetical protein
MQYVGVEVLRAVVVNVAIFWDISPCGPNVNRRFGRDCLLHLQGRKSAKQENSVQQMGMLLCYN